MDGIPRAVEPTRYDARDGRVSRLNQALAWVGIVAGGLFIVAVIFFSGFFLNWSSAVIGTVIWGRDHRLAAARWDRAVGWDRAAPGAAE